MRSTSSASLAAVILAFSIPACVGSRNQKSESLQTPRSDDRLFVTADKSGDIVIRGRTMKSEEEVDAAIGAVKEKVMRRAGGYAVTKTGVRIPDLRVTIQAQAGVKWKPVKTILEACKRNAIIRVSIMLQSEQADVKELPLPPRRIEMDMPVPVGPFKSPADLPAQYSMEEISVKLLYRTRKNAPLRSLRGLNVLVASRSVGRNAEGMEGLEKKLKELARHGTDKAIRIWSSDDCPLQSVVRAIDAGRKAGFKEVRPFGLLITLKSKKVKPFYVPPGFEKLETDDD